MNLATVPCNLPSTGATGVSIIAIGFFAVAIGVVLTRFTSRKHRLPLALILVLVAAICATAPQTASASSAGCSTAPSATLPPIHYRPPSDTTVLNCDNLSPDSNIGYVIPFGADDGTFTGYGAVEFPGGLPTFIGFDDARSWINGYLPTTVTYEWQTLSRGSWSTASWDNGLNPFEITNNQSLLDEVFIAVTENGTARLVIRATDGTTEQVCAVSYWE